MDSASWIGIIFGILVSVWANKRGYAWWAYILASPIVGVIALGIFSTGLAFAIFFTLIADIGPTRASLVTYWNTAIAVVLGVIILNEPLTVGIRIGLPLVMLGSWLVNRREKV